MVDLFLMLHRIIPGHSKLFRRYFYRPFYFIHSYIIGFFLGYFSKKDLEAVNFKIYNKRKSYSTADYNKKPLFEWEQQVIRKFFPNTGKVLITAVGGGREAYNLYRQGYEVTACERNGNLRLFGNDLMKNEGIPVSIEKEEEFLLKARKSQNKYDVVIIGWGAYNHIKGRSERLTYLKSLASFLNKGGIILISFWGQKIYQNHFNQLSLSRIARTANYVARKRGNPPIDCGDILMPEYYHFFTREEIGNDLAACGFEMVRYDEEGYGNAVGRYV